MKAVFKHEFRAYLHSPVSYAVSGLFLIISAVYYTIDNIRGHSGELGALYSAMGTLFLFVLPILTSRIIAEERRSGMETLLFTSPTGIAGIVAGKFFAVFSLIGIMVALTLAFPLILLLFTPLHPLSLFGNYMGLLLLGAFIAALGIFASALTESQAVAAIISFVSLLFLLILRPAASLLGGAGAKILTFISPYARFDEFGRGIVSFGGILYFAGFTFLFLFFTAMLLSSRRNRGLKSGRNWGRLSAASVVAIVIVLNLFAQKYPIKFDFSEGNRYSISETTLALLSDLPRDITVYALFDDSKADRDYLEVCELLEVYKKSSKGRVSIEYRDPDLDTRIVSALDPDGSLDLRKNSFYVTDGARGKKLVYGDLFELQYDGKTSAWFVTGSAAERAITGAISELSKPEATARALYGYTILSAEETPELPEPGESFSELTLAVEATDIVPLEFFGLYFPTASEFDPPEGASVLVPSLGGKALAAAWERDGARHVLIGSADFMSDDVKREYPAHYVTNEYFRSAALEWVNAGNITAPVRDYRTGELQIPVYKANFVGFLTIAVLPFVIFGRGFIVWRGRRYL